MKSIRLEVNDEIRFFNLCLNCYQWYLRPVEYRSISLAQRLVEQAAHDEFNDHGVVLADFDLAYGVTCEDCETSLVVATVEGDYGAN